MNRRSFLSLLASVPLLGRLAPKPVPFYGFPNSGWLPDYRGFWANGPQASQHAKGVVRLLTVEQARDRMQMDPLDVRPDEVVVKDV